MKIYSEKTGKEYKSVEECLSAEKAFEDARAKAEAEKKALSMKREERAKEVEAAYAEVLEAQKKYNKLLSDFVKDYKSFHMTFTDTDPFFSFFDLF